MLLRILWVSLLTLTTTCICGQPKKRSRNNTAKKALEACVSKSKDQNRRDIRRREPVLCRIRNEISKTKRGAQRPMSVSILAQVIGERSSYVQTQIRKNGPLHEEWHKAFEEKRFSQKNGRPAFSQPKKMITEQPLSHSDSSSSLVSVDFPFGLDNSEYANLELQLGSDLLEAVTPLSPLSTEDFEESFLSDPDRYFSFDFDFKKIAEPLNE